MAALRERARRVGQPARIDARRGVSGIPGVASSPDGRVHVTDVGVLPPDPQLSGEAAWDLVDMDRYRRMWQERHGYFSLNMVASRGCPFRCNWCAKPIWGNHYSQRSARQVAAEMGLLKRRSEEHTSELQSLMRISYAVFC